MPSENGVWRTVGGRRIFIKNGQSLSEAMKESGKFPIQLKDEELQAVNRYISSDSYIINEKLRNKEELTEDEKTWLSNLDSALDKLPKAEGRLFRSLSFYDEKSLADFLKNHEIGKIVEYHAYTSASIEKMYNSDGQVQMMILSKNACDMRKFNPGESEALIKRGVSFLVVERTEDSGKSFIILEEVENE